MKEPTQQQLKDSKWWDENDPTGGEATHFVLAGGGLVSAWRHLDDQGDWLSWRYDDGRDGEWAKIKGNDRYLINRPRPAKWQGPQDGLPPVGTECDMCDDRDTFLPVEIIAEKDGYRFGWHKESHRVFYSKDPEEFRPIQSERDKAAYKLARDLGDICPMPEVVNKVIDLGYRKPMSRAAANNAISVALKGVPFSVSQRTSLLDALGYKE